MSQAADERPALKGRALAAWRKARAVELAVQGRCCDDIAREVGFSNRGTAHRAVSQALRERTTAAVEELRTLELLRLDQLPSSSTPPASITAARRAVPLGAASCIGGPGASPARARRAV